MLSRLRRLIHAAPAVAFFIGLGLLVVVILAVVRLRSPPSAAVVTAPVTVADIETTVLATGTVQAYKQVSVGAQASGQLKTLHVALGDTVRSGDLIAEIDPMTEQQALLTAQAALSAVRAQRLAQVALSKQAKLEFERQKQMLAANATPRATYDTAEATLSSTQANIEALDAQIVQAQAAVDAAKVNLGYTRINAPMAGDVVAVITQQGQTVIASQIAPTIIKLAQLNVVTIKAQISEADVVRVKPGQEVYFTILGDPDHRYTSQLRAVEPAPDSINGESGPGGLGVSGGGGSAGGGANSAVYYNGLFDVRNDDRKLRIAMTVQVNIVLDQARQALTVPSAALTPVPSRPAAASVVVVDAQGRQTKREVSVGINNHVNAQILSGLKAGERVVIGTADASVDQDARRALAGH